MSGRARVARALLTSGVLLALAFANAAALRAHWDLENIGTSRRYWEDMTVALSRYETRDWGETPALSIDEAVAIRIGERVRELVPRAAARVDLKPWEFWRTIEMRSFVDLSPFELRFSDDAGRAGLSAIAFKAIGGIAPYFPLWLPLLAFVPLAFWVMFEALRAGEAVAAFVFLAVLASSAYFLEALTLPYSAAGFHLLTALTIFPLALYAFGPPPSARALWTRVVLATIAIHVATWCRSSSIIFLPVVALLLIIALVRAEATSSALRKVALSVLILVTLMSPRLAAPKQSHEFWVGMWEGLGDFDREHGHVWSDHDARIALDNEGQSMQRRGPYWTEETEAVFKRLVLHDLRTDPAWYVKILGKRVIATVTQWRLRPRGTADGLTYLAPQHIAEGFTDVYYNFVKTADVFTLLGRTWEAPLALFWGLGLGFIATALALMRAVPWQRRLGVVVALAVGALLMPVAVTTASGIEMQVFVFVFWLCGAFLISALIRRLGLSGSDR